MIEKNAPPLRSEQEIFADLHALCTQPGFVHVLAYVCFRDNMVFYNEDVTVEHLREVFGPDKLIRTEITTLLGLMVKAPVDWTVPAREVQQTQLEASERLLLELHQVLSAAWNLGAAAAAIERGEEFNPFDAGPAMREPMFYAAESAYDFQYLDLAAQRYAADAPWLQAHRGFTIADACRVADGANQLHQGRFDALREQMRNSPPEVWSMVPGFSFSAAEVAAQTAMDPALVQRILDAFTMPAEATNAGFASVHDFNVVTATPLLRHPNGEYVSLQNYALAQAIYDSPFHWMLSDKAYRATQDKHRGEFTETFVAERLASVFGAERVLLNVNIWEGKGKKVGEIDVLVLWADRAIIVQAKSKKLTIEARKGNDQVIRDDFQKSVQDAYDQGLLCAECLDDPKFRITQADGTEVPLDVPLNEIFVLCVVSDYYPALSFQARQFLKTREVPRVRTALVTDVFLIDVLTELLQSPLRFLSYVARRTRYGDRLLAAQEMTILGYHLKHNLWFDEEQSLIHLDEEFALPIDIAMAVRRRGLAGAATPDGLLTRYEGTTLGRLLHAMEAQPEGAVLDQGFQLLELDGETLDDLNRLIDTQAQRAAQDGKPHNLALVFPDRSGFTALISAQPNAEAVRSLSLLAARRKYLQKADLWFGLCLTPGTAQLRFGLRLASPWQQDDRLDAAAAEEAPAPPMTRKAALARLMRGGRTTPKVGRNDPCPCGSGKKSKKCCGK